MGVKRAWKALHKKGRLISSPQKKISLSSSSSKIRIDLCSTHNTPIRIFYGATTDLNASHCKLERMLLRIGDKSKLRIYVDGNPAVEKQDTHANRDQERRKALLKADAAISNLETRLATKRRVRKHHIATASKHLRQAFHWPLEHRQSFVQYMSDSGYDVVLCSTEADVLIASECQLQDAVVSCDSDMLFYRTIPIVWRPVGAYTSRKFIQYKKLDVLETLGLSSTQLTALAILSGNDYVENIPFLAFETNRTIIRDMSGDERSIIKQYLAHKRVRRQTINARTDWTERSYAAAIKVFVDFQQSVASPIDQPIASAHTRTENDTVATTALSYSVLSKRMDSFMAAFRASKKDAYEDRVSKRVAQEAQSEQKVETRVTNPFATIDRQVPANAHQYRPRFTPKIRFEPSEEQPAPAISVQYELKPWKAQPKEECLPNQTIKKITAKIKPEIDDNSRYGRKEMMNALLFEHPIVTLDLDRLSSNVRAAVEDDLIAKTAVECIRGAVEVAWETKKRCQVLIGMYLEDLFYPVPSPGAPRPTAPVTTINKDDQCILDNLCPRFSSKEMNSDEGDANVVEDGQNDGTNAQFIRSFLMFIYSGNLPGKSKVDSAVKTFIGRLQKMGHLEKVQVAEVDMLRQNKEYTPNYVVRSVASQISAELKRHYKHGSKEISAKVQAMIKKGRLNSDQQVDLASKEPAIQLFVRANAAVGRPWRLSPLSSEEHGFMTFTEIELAAFFHKRVELHPVLKDLVGCTDQQRRLTQEELTRDWLPLQVPGMLIQRLVAPVDPRTPDGQLLHGRLKKKAGVLTSVKVVEPEEMRSHINGLRGHSFDPRAYQEKGYFLHGSIRTDGYTLQLLAFKLRELNSVKFKRYQDDLLPDRLLTTTAGTDDFLTEVRNIFKTPDDVKRLLGCTPDEAGKVSYLGLDLGQAFVVGAYGLLPEDKVPKLGKRRDHRQQKKRGSRGHHSRGSGKGNKKDVDQTRGERHINLAAKQKAVMQPTLKHRAWMERQKAINLKKSTDTESAASSAEAMSTEYPSIGEIESSLPPLCGTNACFADHIKHRSANKESLNRFYNKQGYKFKKFKRMSRMALKHEFIRLTDSLLRIVGGSIGEKKKEGNKVLIGIGMGRFTSTTRLSSLHGSFEAFFIRKARALGYLVVGVQEYYTSKRCPKCQQFVAQAENIRRYFCHQCKKYMHRDIMAAHNMVNILRGHVEQQQRPLYLHPVDGDGHFPWLEPPEDSSDSLQQASSSGSHAGHACRSGRKRQRDVDGGTKETDNKRAATAEQLSSTNAIVVD